MTAPVEVNVTTSPVEVTVTAEPPVEVTTALTGTFVESGGAGTPEDLDYSSSPDIGEALADDDEFPVSNTSSGSSVVSALSRVWTYVLSKMPFASQAEMEAGTETSTRSMSPERVKQAIDALSSGGDLADDSTPQLGGDLDLVTHSIVTTADRDITLTPNGTGNIVLGTVTLDADQTVGVGQDNFVLTYDNATGLLSLEEAAAGGGGGDYEDGGEAGGADRTLGNTDSFDLGFLTDNTTRLHVQSDGNVGIGTDSPQNILDINAGAVIGSSYAGVETAPTDGLLVEGNVGIGTSSASQALDLIGSLELEDTTTSTTGVIYKGADRFIHNFAASGTNGQNTFVGEASGNFTLTGSATGLDGSFNVGVGSEALEALTTGYLNVGVGGRSLWKLTSGSRNVGIGYGSLWNLTTGNYNVGIGPTSLASLTTASYAASFGTGALARLTTGGENTAVGYYAGGHVGEGSWNTVLGSQALGEAAGSSLNTHSGNTAVGRYALHVLTAGDFNTSIGMNSGSQLANGNRNTFIGKSSGDAYTTGDENTLLGANAGTNGTTGSGNTIVGEGAAISLTTGSSNLVLGNNADVASATGDYQLNIGNTIYGDLASDNIGIGVVVPLNTLDINGAQVIGSSYAGVETAPTDGLLIEGNVGIGITAPDTLLDINGAVTQRPLSADPADPDDGNSVQWVSDGTGSGDAGDVMMKITVGATTKTITVADFSAA